MPPRRFEPIPLEQLPAKPVRYSQTLLKHADRCPRAALFYIETRGGAPALPLNRGTLFHTFAERLMVELISRGERSLGGEGGDVAALSSAMMDAVLEEHPDVPVTAADADALRAAAYHTAIGLDTDPETVVAIERRFHLEVAGRTVVGVIDLAAMPDPYTLHVDDFKTTLNVPRQEEYEGSFQGKLYALLAAEGHPVRREGDEWVADDGIGSFVQRFRTRELYPRVALRDDRLTARSRWLTRAELLAFKGDLERTIARVEHGFETGEWPAVYGPHCSECPCEPKCPIPRHSRRFAGAINTREEASEALEWALRQEARVRATKDEVKAWAKHNGPVPVGADVYYFETSHGRQIRRRGRSSDWEGLEEAVLRAANFGEPFAVEDFLIPKTTTSFKKMKGEEGVPDGDAGADGAGGDAAGAGEQRSAADVERERDERFGADAPF